jgi:hypothetical protein
MAAGGLSHTLKCAVAFFADMVSSGFANARLGSGEGQWVRTPLLLRFRDA